MPTRLVSDAYRPAEGFYASVVESPRRLPVVTFLPTGYEPNYPYPLVVFFHGQGGNEKQIVRLAPRLSRRNYICVGLRGPHCVVRQDNGQVGYSWDLEGQGDAFAEEYVFRAVEQARRSYHVHSERIFLAGFCEGASLAYRLGLTYPEKFGGVISLNGQMPRGGRPLLNWPRVRNLRVLIGHGIANPMITLGSAKRDLKLLYVAGLKVNLKTYPTTHRLHPDMLRDIDRWIMGGVESAEL